MKTTPTPARLLDAQDKTLSEGLAYAPTGQSTVTYYPSDGVNEALDLKSAATLSFSDTKIALTHGRRCECPGRLHYHFERE